jgi:hypothetical protein
MKYFWTHHTENSHTLMRLRNDERPHRVAYVSPTFKFGDDSVIYDSKWKAQIISTREVAVFSSIDQAKDWAQAVVLLNQ